MDLLLIASAFWQKKLGSVTQFSPKIKKEGNMMQKVVAIAKPQKKIRENSHTST